MKSTKKKEVVVSDKDTTLTPLWIINAIGEFDLDPCGFIGHNTAKKLICLPKNGLTENWNGRIWLNPPYSNPKPFLERMVEHNNGVALVLASVETEWFFNLIWNKASGIFFLKGRPKFLRKDKSEVQLMRSTVLVSYGENCKELLKNCKLDGKYVDLYTLNPKTK